MFLPTFLILIFSCFFSKVEKTLTLSFIVKSSLKEPVVKQGRYLGKFKISFYWIGEEKYYKGKRNVPLYLEDGTLLGYFPKDFVKDFKIESCAQLRDGRIISYLKKKDRVKIVDNPLGYGFKLIPLKSAAVDTNFIKLGSMLYIPNLSGLKINENKNHNGIFYVHDIGSKIKGRKIDIFLGYKHNYYIFKNAGITPGTEVDIYLLE